MLDATAKEKTQFCGVREMITIVSAAGKTYTYPNRAEPSLTHDMIVAIRKRGYKVYSRPDGTHKVRNRIMNTKELRAWAKAEVRAERVNGT